MSNFILKVFLCLLLLGTWESGLDKVSTEIQGLSSTDCNFQRLSRPWIFILKFKDYQELSSYVQTLHVVFCRWWGQDTRITYFTITERFGQELWSITVQTTEMTRWLHNNFSFSFLHAQFSEKRQGKWTSKTALRFLNSFKTLLWFISHSIYYGRKNCCPFLEWLLYHNDHQWLAQITPHCSQNELKYCNQYPESLHHETTDNSVFTFYTSTTM